MVSAQVQDLEPLDGAADRGATRLAALFRAAVAAQSGRVALWTPVAMGIGAALYIGGRSEPGWLDVAWPLCATVLTILLLRALRAPPSIVAVAILAVFAASGYAAGKIRTFEVQGPVAPETGAVRIVGWVVDVASPGQSGGRLVIAPTRIGALSNEQLPNRIRITARDDLIGPGAAIAFTGLINPPPAPASPGAYDFARNAFFDGIGGVGVALTQPEIVTLSDPPLRLRLTMRLNAMRWSLAQHIAADMSPTARGMGVAMVTGHEAWLDQDTQQNLRDSGLAHIVSISGLHMAIVGGFAFLLARWLISAIPWLALRIDGKKTAAVFGLVAVGAYLVVSGAPAPAQRAAITAAVAFGAILCGRRAITLRALAIAALIIIALQPEAVSEAGFGMSFCATAALVALAEQWRPPPREISVPWPIRLAQSAGLWIIVSLAASLVAGLATGPFAIQDFNRVAVFGLPTNVAIEPLSSFVMMPSLALGAVLEPFGLGKPFLVLASWSIDFLQGGAGWIAGRPHAVMLVASAPAAALPVAFLGILWMCLWKGAGRWLALPAALAVTLWPRPEPPFAWVDNEGGQAAVRQGSAAVPMRPQTRLFGADYWARRRGLVLPDDGLAAQAGVFDCDRSSCRALYADGPRLSLWWSTRAPPADRFSELCNGADIVVIRAKTEPQGACNAKRILRPADFERGGALEIHADGRLVWAQPLRGDRPWTRPPSGTGG